jgi:hypothetical protein
MVELNAMEGDYQLNPFNFEHFNLKSLSIFIDGRQIPIEGYQLNFDRHQYIDAYQEFLENTVKFGVNKNNGISRTRWANGNTIFALDLTDELDAIGQHLNVIKQGSLRIDVRFHGNLQKNINILVYGETMHMMEIDNNRTIALDYKV